MNRVGGNAAVYIDPNDEIGAAQTLREVLHETEGEKRERIAAGLRQAKQFSTAPMVDSYLRAYENVRGKKRLLNCSIYVRNLRNLRL